MAKFLMLSFRRMVIDRHGLYSVIVKHGILVELRVFFFSKFLKVGPLVRIPSIS
jgi:hypothetical protein